MFEAYADISDKVAGLLVRARKYGLCFFEGETLWQRFDDRKPVVLLLSSVQARELLTAGADDPAGEPGGARDRAFHWGALARPESETEADGGGDAGGTAR